MQRNVNFKYVYIREGGKGKEIGERGSKTIIFHDLFRTTSAV